MFTAKLYRLSRASLAGAVLLGAVCLLLSVAQARWQTGKAQTEASSLADDSLPSPKLISGVDKAYLNNMLSFPSPAFSQLSSPTCLATATGFNSEKIKSEKPPANPGRIAGEILAGLSGTGLAIGLGYAAEDAAKDDNYLGPALLAVTPFSCALGVWLVGNIGNEAGSYWTAFGGTWLGILSSFVYTGVRRGDVNSLGEAIFVLSLPAVWSTVIFNRTRKYDPPPASKTGLLNFRDGHLSCAVPTTYLMPDKSDRFRVKPSKKRTKHLDLVRVDF